LLGTIDLRSIESHGMQDFTASRFDRVSVKEAAGTPKTTRQRTARSALVQLKKKGLFMGGTNLIWLVNGTQRDKSLTVHHQVTPPTQLPGTNKNELC